MYQLLAALPDKRLASATLTNTIHIWDINTGARLATLRGHKRPIEALTVFRGDLLVSGASDGTIRFWDIARYVEVARIGSLEDANFEGQDDSFMIRPERDPASIITYTGLEHNPALISSLLALPSGRLAYSPDLTIRIVDVDSSLEVCRLRGHTDRILTLATLPNGVLASGSADGTIRLWDVQNRAESFCLVGHRGWVTCLIGLSDGRLVSCSRDGTIRVWDVGRGKEVKRITAGATYSRDDLFFADCLIDGGFTSIALLPDGHLISGGVDETIRCWNIDTGDEEGRLVAHTQHHSLLHDSAALEVVSERRFMSLVTLDESRVAAGAWTRTSRIPRRMLKITNSLFFVPDETIRIWDVGRNAEVWHRDDNAVFRAVSSNNYMRHADLSTPMSTLRIRDTSLPELDYYLTPSPTTVQAVEPNSSKADAEARWPPKGNAVGPSGAPAEPISIDDLKVRYRSDVIAPIDRMNLHSVHERADGVITLPSWDATACSVFAPTAIRSFAHAMIQVFLHRADDGRRVVTMALAVNPDAGRQITRDLNVKLMPGQVVEVDLELAGLDLSADSPKRQTLTWSGRPESVNFEITAPFSVFGRKLFPKIRIAVDGVVVGSIVFLVDVGLFKSCRPGMYTGHARQYRRAFLSYSSADRGEVLKRAQVLKLAGIEVFQDVIHLQPGERWYTRLLAEIRMVDVVFLFWSRSAKQSKWVIREVRLALKQQQSNPSRAPDIIPVILEVPPPQPPRFLKHLHFNDPLAPALALYASNVRVAGD